MSARAAWADIATQVTVASLDTMSTTPLYRLTPRWGDRADLLRAIRPDARREDDGGQEAYVPPVIASSAPCLRGN
jgi:hypothetical protein